MATVRSKIGKVRSTIESKPPTRTTSGRLCQGLAPVSHAASFATHDPSLHTPLRLRCADGPHIGQEFVRFHQEDVRGQGGCKQRAPSGAPSRLRRSILIRTAVRAAAIVTHARACTVLPQATRHRHTHTHTLTRGRIPRAPEKWKSGIVFQAEICAVKRKAKHANLGKLSLRYRTAVR